MSRRVSPRTAGAAALAVSAFLVTHEAFRSVEHRFALQGQRQGVDVDLTAQEPMHLEFELSVQAEGDGESGVALRMNDAPIAKVVPETRFAFQRIRVPIPATAVHSGRNRLEFEAYGPDGTHFELRGRLHNYFGINPRFPRAFVVSDEAAWRRWSQLGAVAALVRCVVFGIAGFALVVLFARTLALLDMRAGIGVLLLPSMLLWAVLV
jgi:hypothetical protein